MSTMDDGKTEDEPNPPQNLNDLEPQPTFTPTSVGGKGKKKLIVLGVVILLILGAAIYFLRTKTSQPQASPSPSLKTPAPEVLSTPIPQPTFDRSKYTLRILNGTKLNGLAASTSAKLKDLGYKIDKTANATNSAFPQTLVRVKAGYISLLEQLIKDLKLDFEAKEGPAIETSDTVDVEVILGTK